VVLEGKQEECGSVTMGGITFNSESDCLAFVVEHLPNPNFGLLSDMVILLRKLKIKIPTNESVVNKHHKAMQVKLDKTEAGTIASYSVTVPSAFNRETEDMLSSHLQGML